MKTILGFIHHTHDAAATLLDGEKFLAAVEEERINKDKHTNSFPGGAILECLKIANINSKDISHIAYPWNPWLRVIYGIYFTMKNFPSSMRVLARRGDGDFFQILNMEKTLITFFKENNLSLNYEKFHFIDHHTAHSAYGFYTSPFEKALIYTHDFCGEYHSIHMGIGEGNKIRNIAKIAYPNSLGFIFNAITKYLGFLRNSDEGKVMGLAPYGDDRYIEDFKKFVILKNNGTFQLDTSWFDIFFYDLKNGGESELVSKKFIKKFGAPRLISEELNNHHRGIANALQHLLYHVNEHIINHFMRLYKLENLVVSGGVFLNSCANGLILENSNVKNLHIPPAAGDAGTAKGAALYVRNNILGNKKRVSSSPYMGSSYTDKNIEKKLKQENVNYKKVKDIVDTTTDLLIDGKVIGWFQGRMEFGPRALGSRSILADPRKYWMRDYINKEVKHRELFRPLAPSMCLESFKDFFHGDPPSPYMLKVYKAKNNVLKQIPAVLHVDNTARVQTVSKTDNPLYHKLLENFGQKTGIPILLNTSFNDKGEPIVNTPEDSIKFFLNSKIDYLAIGNFLVSKETHED